jgi:hypothetical protein
MFAIMQAPVVERRCLIEEVFTMNFIELLAMAPRNPIVRGLLLALTRKMPPPECQDYDQIKDWVELNCDRKLRPQNALPAATEGIPISVDFSDTEYGRASYSVSRSGTEQFLLDEAELVDMVQGTLDADEGLDSLVESVARQIKESAWDRCDPSMQDSNDYDYMEHDRTDTENGTVEFSKAEIRERLVGFLREHHPDLLEELI